MESLRHIPQDKQRFACQKTNLQVLRPLVTQQNELLFYFCLKAFSHRPNTKKRCVEFKENEKISKYQRTVSINVTQVFSHHLKYSCLVT